MVILGDVIASSRYVSLVLDMKESNIFTKLLRYWQGILGLNRDDYLLSSFPRSGNTWIRFILCNLISLEEWAGKEVDFEVMNRTMLVFGVDNLREPWQPSMVPRVIKTHRRYYPFFKKAGGSIGIIRDPRDVMVSNYHYEKDRKSRYEGEFSDFIRHHNRLSLESWFKHYVSWRNHWTLVIRYEEMRSNIFSEVLRILSVMDVELSDDKINDAISRSDIESVQKIEQNGSARKNKQSRFARDGKTDQWVGYFSEEDREYFYQLSKKYKVDIYQ